MLLCGCEWCVCVQVCDVQRGTSDVCCVLCVCVRVRGVVVVVVVVVVWLVLWLLCVSLISLFLSCFRDVDTAVTAVCLVSVCLARVSE